jgi:hypothetical protein
VEEGILMYPARREPGDSGPASYTAAGARFVTVGLHGGLGNQLFQYAMGRAIAECQGRSLILDDVALQIDRPGATKREYALGIFDIEPALTSRTPGGGPPVQLRLVEDRRGFHAHLLQPSSIGHVYLAGYWQDPRYFAGLGDRLRRELRIRPGVGESPAWSERIASERTPVALHVRRTDYLTGSAGRARFGFVGHRYYERAIRTMREHTSRPHFFVFSDDREWCKRHLRFDDPHAFVGHDALSVADAAATDLRLMSQCRHFIIANSSYSWWAAWLGAHADKTVIAPRAWFRDVPSDSVGVTPGDWLRV